MDVHEMKNLTNGFRFYATCGQFEVWMDFDKQGNRTDGTFKVGTAPSISLEVKCRNIAKRHNLW